MHLLLVKNSISILLLLMTSAAKRLKIFHRQAAGCASVCVGACVIMWKIGGENKLEILLTAAHSVCDKYLTGKLPAVAGN